MSHCSDDGGPTKVAAYSKSPEAAFDTLSLMSMAVGRFDLEEHRKRLRKMTDAQLLQHGNAAQEVVNDKNPPPVYVVQLSEARAEWRRRHQKVGERNDCGVAP